MIRWADSVPRLRPEGGLFRLGDVVPEGHFTEAEIADLVARGKVSVTESRQVELCSPTQPEAEVPELPKTEELDMPKTEELDEPKAEELEQHDTVDLGAESKSKPKRWRKS